MVNKQLLKPSELPKTQSGAGYFTPGKSPKGGFQSMWLFAPKGKASASTKPEKK